VLSESLIGGFASLNNGEQYLEAAVTFRAFATFGRASLNGFTRVSSSSGNMWDAAA
jgi:hypothetical protein